MPKQTIRTMQILSYTKEELENILTDFLQRWFDDKQITTSIRTDNEHTLWIRIHNLLQKHETKYRELLDRNNTKPDAYIPHWLSIEQTYALPEYTSMEILKNHILPKDYTPKTITNDTITFQKEWQHNLPNDKNNAKIKHLSMDEQIENYPGLYYEMQLTFQLDVGFHDISEILKNCGFQEEPIIKDAQTLTINQTLPVIPDENTIHAYENAMVGTKYENNLYIKRASFTGFTYIKPIEIKESEES